MWQLTAIFEKTIPIVNMNDRGSLSSTSLGENIAHTEKTSNKRHIGNRGKYNWTNDLVLFLPPAGSLVELLELVLSIVLDMETVL